MAPTFSKFISHSVQNSSASTFESSNAPVLNYFITDSNNRILNNVPGLGGWQEGWQEDTKTWGLLWTMKANSMPKMDMYFKQKLVKVTTKTGETVMAITFDTSGCSVNFPTPYQANAQHQYKTTRSPLSLLELPDTASGQQAIHLQHGGELGQQVWLVE